MNSKRTALDNFQHEFYRHLPWYMMYRGNAVMFLLLWFTRFYLVIRGALVQGKGGMLLFLWAAGLFVFLSVLSLSLYAIGWTGTSVVFFLLMMHGYGTDPDVQRYILRIIMAKRFPLNALNDAPMSAVTGQAVEVFMEIAVRTQQIEKKHGRNSELRHALIAADEMIALQYESAKQAKDLEEVLGLVQSGGRTGLLPDSPGSDSSPASRLRQENIAAIERAAADARALTDHILQRLETLLLQVVQLDRQTSDMVHTTEFAQETEAMLKQLQSELDLRRKTAQSFITMMTTG